MVSTSRHVALGRKRSTNPNFWVWISSGGQESPRQTKPKKGPKRKVHEFRPFLWILVFLLRKTSTIHIELLFRNAPAKSSWTDLSLVWFAGATLEVGWGSSTRKGGGQKVRYVPQDAGKQSFWRDIPDFARISRGHPTSLREKRLCSLFGL